MVVIPLGVGHFDAQRDCHVVGFRRGFECGYRIVGEQGRKPVRFNVPGPVAVVGHEAHMRPSGLALGPRCGPFWIILGGGTRKKGHHGRELQKGNGGGRLPRPTKRPRRLGVRHVTGCRMRERGAEAPRVVPSAEGAEIGPILATRRFGLELGLGVGDGHRRRAFRLGLVFGRALGDPLLAALVAG